ncbi:MAG: hypothetical protein WC860_05395 [Candidatus Margulisiibacteriota bacterium]|jgi:hypothetical protein
MTISYINLGQKSSSRSPLTSNINHIQQQEEPLKLPPLIGQMTRTHILHIIPNPPPIFRELPLLMMLKNRH